MMKNFVFILSILFFTTAATAGTAPDKNRNRIEELFLWRVSDSLGLSPSEEAAFKKIMSHVREERTKRSEQVEDVLKNLEKETGAKGRDKLLIQYKNAVKHYNASHLEEIEQIEKLLGGERLARYLVLKDHLLNKLKGALADASLRDKGLKTKVKDPKIIQEE